MARYNTRIQDFDVSLPMKPINLRTPARKLLDGSGRYEKAIKTVQEGVTSFGRKPKMPCRLSSSHQIRNSIKKTAKNVVVHEMAHVWKPIPLV